MRLAGKQQRPCGHCHPSERLLRLGELKFSVSCRGSESLRSWTLPRSSDFIHIPDMDSTAQPLDSGADGEPNGSLGLK
jgi:hypothetical protein